ncbi:MAG: M50 family metallopeptidase [Gemmatimonadota bacterium]|nr:M50 family metallopeptidase [Gemmatimonadota bacterium]
MANRTWRKLRFLFGFGVFFTALWFFWETPVVYPLKIFVVLLHELSHAGASLATGGSVHRIDLDPYQGGACYCPGGNAFLVLSAGYLGSLAWGGAMFAAARGRRTRTDTVNAVIAGIIVVATLLYVRSGFGIAFGLAFGTALFWIARRASGGINRAVLLTLGLTSSLYAILDIKSDVLDRPELRSDAAMLAEITGIPTLVWGIVWIGIALAFSGRMLLSAYRTA